MKNLYQRLLLLIAGATQLELARHVRYLKIENEILRSKLPKRVPVTPKEQNRLVKFRAKLGKALSELVTIVHPDTLRRWIRDSQQKAKKKPVKKGCPRTQEQIRELILKLARENDWGYTRILGELRKLGVKAVSRNTVKNILKENGLDPGPKRGAGHLGRVPEVSRGDALAVRLLRQEGPHSQRATGSVSADLPPR